MKNSSVKVNLKMVIKGVIASLIVGVYFLVTIPLSFILPLAPFKIRTILSYIVTFFCYLMRLNLNMKIELDQSEESLTVLNRTNAFIVANHVSYTDIFALASLMPACFVTSLEMKKTPLLGQITLAAGCLFVDRKNRTNIEKEVENVVDGLKNKLNVCIFPEAKSTNGDEVLLFRKSMFNAAILANSPILPLTMNYQSIDGQKLTRSNRDQLFWYGDMTFYPHILSVLKLNEIKLKIKVHPLVKVADKESDIDLANRVQKIVAKDYQNLSHS